MKLQILQENFSKALSASSRFVSNKAQLPVLANVLLKAHNTKLVLSATNLEVSLVTSVGAKIEQDGSITIPAKTLYDVISNLNRGPITLEAQGEHLSVKNEQADATLLGINASEFPAIPDSISDKSIKIKKDELLTALSQVVFSASSDETRPILTGVLVVGAADGLVLVGTDGFRLSQKKLSIDNSQLSQKTIVPKTALLELSRIGSDETLIELEIKESENQILFKSGDTVLSSRVIEGEFPPFERIIPKESSVHVSVDKQSFLRAVKLASVFARDGGNIGKIKIGEGFVELQAESSRSGNQHTQVEAKVEGGPLEIMYNLRFIEEFLQVCKGEDIEMHFTDSSSPGVFKDLAEPDFLHLIMPVKIQS